MLPAQHGHDTVGTGDLFTTAQPAMPASVNMHTLYALITKMDQDIKSRFDGLTGQLNNVYKDIKSMKHDITELDNGMKSIDTDMMELKDDTLPKLEKKLGERIDQLEQTRLEAELYSKKSNLLFFNIPKTMVIEDTELVLRSVLDNLSEVKQSDILFVNVHRLPSRASNNTTKPIIAKFIRMKDRDAVLTAMTQAKIKVDGKNIIAVPHLPQKMQQERKRLVVIRNQLIEDGMKANIKVSGTSVQLYANGSVWKEK
jgi:flagellar hook-associated protein FlgK